MYLSSKLFSNNCLITISTHRIADDLWDILVLQINKAIKRLLINFNQLTLKFFTMSFFLYRGQFILWNNNKLITSVFYYSYKQKKIFTEITCDTEYTYISVSYTHLTMGCITPHIEINLFTLTSLVAH